MLYSILIFSVCMCYIICMYVDMYVFIHIQTYTYNYFFLCYGKTLDKSYLRRTYLGLQFKGTVHHIGTGQVAGVTRLWKPQHEGVGYIVSTVRRQRERHTDAAFTVSIWFSPGSRPRDDAVPFQARSSFFS